VAKPKFNLIISLHNTAFSLIELLVTIAIVGVLIAILLPAVGAAMRAAHGTRSLSSLRSHAQAFGMYNGDFGDMYPYFTRPEGTTAVGDPDILQLPQALMFDAHRTWHLVLGPLYYDTPAGSDIFFPDGSFESETASYPFFTPFAYPCVFIARPEFWSATTRNLAGHFGPTRAHEVRYPSDKSLVVLTWPFTDPSSDLGPLSARSLPAAMADGSASNLSGSERRAGYHKGEGVEFMDRGAVHFTDFPPLLHTLEGVRGRDRR